MMESFHSPIFQYRLRKIRPSGKKEATHNNIFLSEENSTTVGRVQLDDVQIKLHSRNTPLMISRKHATLTVVDNHVFVIDHDSINGVYIRNKRIEAGAQQEIRIGDRVAFGCGIQNGPPEFDYILEAITVNKSFPVETQKSHLESPAKRRRIVESPIITIIESNTAQIKEQEQKISTLANNLKEKEETYNKLLNQLQETETGMLKKLEEQKLQLESERVEAEMFLKDLLQKQLLEKESLLRSEYDTQIRNLENEKDLVEKNLQDELSKKLSQKDEVYQKELEQQKLQLGKSMIDKESEKQRLINELNVKESLIEKYKSVEKNQKQLETCLEELRKEITEKDNQLKEQKEVTKKVEQSAKQNVIQTIEDEFTCIICQELFIEATTLPCAHTFCDMCLRLWLKKKKNCPVCRRRLKGKAVRSLVLDSVVEKMLETMDEASKKRRADLQKEREAQKKRDDSTEDLEGIRELFHNFDDDDTEDPVQITRNNDRSSIQRDPRNNRRENYRRRSRSRSPRNHRHRHYNDNRYNNNNPYHFHQGNHMGGYLFNQPYNVGGGAVTRYQDRSGNFHNFFQHGFHNQPVSQYTHHNNNNNNNNNARCYNCGGLDHIARYCPRS